MGESNHRNTFRVPFELEAEVFRHGAISKCLILNMSAGGMLLATNEQVEPHEQLTLGVRLFDDLRKAAGIDYLNFQLEVLEVLEREDEEQAVAQEDGSGEPAVDWGPWQRHLRCRNMTTEGSAAYERAHKLVFEAERRRLAHLSGAEESSPMVSDHGRRESLHPHEVERYSRESINPLFRN